MQEGSKVNRRVNKSDNWENVYKGFGGNQDVTKDTSFGSFRVISDAELASMYTGDGWAKKLIKAPADDMTRSWISLSDDADTSIATQLEDLGAKEAFNEAIRWARLFRGGIIWMVSSRDRMRAYKENEKIDIKKLKVYSASQFKVTKWDDGKRDPSRYGEPLIIKIVPPGTNTVSFEVNASQCLLIKGEALPVVSSGGFSAFFPSSEIAIEEYFYWGTSIIQSIFMQLSRYGTFEQGMGSIGTEIIVAIYKIAGLREILQADDGAELMARRMEVMNQAKSILNAVFLDAEGDEDFSRNTPQLGGVSELWDKFMMVLSGITDIPASRLFGRQASGLNNKGEMDERNYNAYLTGQQDLKMKGPLKQLLGHLTGGKVPFTFNNPWQPSQQELVAMKETQSKIDDIYIRDGILMEEEVRKSRFEGTYSFETELLDGVFDPNEPAPEPDPNSGV